MRAVGAGQAMVEMALGVSLFLLAALAALQLGSSGFASEGAQSAALVGARTASSAPLPGAPLARLEQGQAAAAAALASSTLGMAGVPSCFDGGAGSGACGLPQRCQRYRGSSAVGATVACPLGSGGGAAEAAIGPAPADLDGSQNPACGSGACFGVAASMAPCRESPAAGRLVICLAYDAWPASQVDIWIRGSLRSLVPLVSSAGLDALPVSDRLRLQVESLSS